MNTDSENQRSFPQKIIVSLQAGGLFFALANVVCVAILAWTYLTVKLEPKTLQVTGSARKAIKSDWVAWHCSIYANNENLSAAYDTLKKSAELVNAYLLKNGVNESEITFSSITTSRRYHKEFLYPKEGREKDPEVITTEKVENYSLTQHISISSANVMKIPEISNSITCLIKDGVEIDSGEVCYLYTKLAELKIDMLAEATKDATTRAGQIVNNANGSLGKLVEARMGVIQINPKGSTATSGEGNNDTTSFEKEICTVVSARFEVN